jgi:hypothetical protein
MLALKNINGFDGLGIGLEGHDYDEISSLTTPEERALDCINPGEKGFEETTGTVLTGDNRTFCMQKGITSEF